MVPHQIKYHLVIRPGIFQDGTYGVYAVPSGRTDIEYQVRGRFNSVEEANQYGEECQRFAPESFDGIPEVREDREVDLPRIGVGDSEEDSAAALKLYAESLLSAPSGFKKRLPWARLSAGTPYLFSLAAITCYFFNITIPLPGEVPLLGEYLAGTQLSPDRIARWFPVVLAGLVIVMQIRVRQTALRHSDVRDHVLFLALKCSWRREQFVKLMQGVVRSKGFGWLRKIYDWIHSWDPDTVHGIAQQVNKRLANDNDAEEIRREFATFYDNLNAEDFECRIHALYYMSLESSFRPWVMIVPPLQILMSNRRAVRRAQFLLRGGLKNLIFLDLAALPDREDHRISRKLFWPLTVWPVIALGGALLWSFLKIPWPTPFGWIGMTSVFVLVLGPILFWNYQLFVNWRGLPSGMAWVDLQAPMKLIQAQ